MTGEYIGTERRARQAMEAQPQAAVCTVGSAPWHNVQYATPHVGIRLFTAELGKRPINRVLSLAGYATWAASVSSSATAQ
jgi:hypothetical protein